MNKPGSIIAPTAFTQCEKVSSSFSDDNDDNSNNYNTKVITWRRLWNDTRLVVLSSLELLNGVGWSAVQHGVAVVDSQENQAACERLCRVSVSRLHMWTIYYIHHIPIFCVYVVDQRFIFLIFSSSGTRTGYRDVTGFLLFYGTLGEEGRRLKSCRLVFLYIYTRTCHSNIWLNLSLRFRMYSFVYFPCIGL